MRTSIAAMLVLAACTPFACGQKRGESDDSPKSETDARASILAKWKTVMPMLPDDFLLVYVEASRMLLAQGIDATYTFKSGIKDVNVDAPPGVTFHRLAVGLYFTEIQLQSPPPPEVLVLMEQKLKHRKPSPFRPLDDVLAGRGKKQGSSATLAGDVWRKAEMKVRKNLQSTAAFE